MPNLTSLKNLVSSFRKGAAPAISAVSDTGGKSFVKDFLFGPKSFVREHPFLSATGGIMMGSMVGEPIYEGIRSGFTDYDINQQMQLVQAERASRRQQAGMNLQREETERELGRQAARLAAVSPHLYNQIMAGRRLPQGAVILGGTPRTDLMEQIAQGMASNPRLQQQQQQQLGPGMAPQEQFFSELGV